jgi:hypothetical protein
MVHVSKVNMVWPSPYGVPQVSGKFGDERKTKAAF